MENDLPDQIQNKIDIESRPILVTQNILFHLGIQQRPVDGHEISADIELEYVTVLLIVMRTRTKKMLDALDAVGRAFSRAATVTVMDEQPFEKRADVVVHQMMNDPIAEIGGKDLPQDGLFRHEAKARADIVSPFDDFPM